jgi:tyrosine-protein phosphatase YwqE
MNMESQTRKLAEKLVKEDMVDLIGSDFHRPQHIEVMKMAIRNKTLQKLIASGRIRNQELFQ